MNTIDLAPSSNNDNYIHPQHSLLPSFNEHNNDSIGIITNIVNHTTVNCNMNVNRTKLHRPSTVVKRGLLYTRALRTERCSKHMRASGAAVRKSKVQTNLLRQQLEKQVQELEFKQSHLLSQVEDLYLYKHQLEKAMSTNEFFQFMNYVYE